MSLLKFDPTWRLMKQFHFEVDPDFVNERLMCILCKRLTIDTYEATCGCRFCHHCVEWYSRDQSNHCPGGKNECKDELLMMDVNVTRNLRTSNKVWKVKVFCPNETCHAKVELREMEEHLGMCKQTSIQCPLMPLGCGTEKTSKETMLNHLHNESLSHMRMLIEWVENLENKFNDLKEDFREKCRENENRIETLEDEAMNMANKVLMLENQSSTKEEKIVLLENEIRMLRDKAADETDEKSGSTNQKGDGCQYDNEKVKMLMDDVKDKVDEIRRGRKMIDNRDRIIRYWIKWNHLCPDVDADFIWKIDNLSLKRNTFVCSEHFHSKGYNFFLHYCLHGNDDLKIGCYITRGDHDYAIQWPMKRPITISILDQETMTEFSTATYRYNTYCNHKAFNIPSGGSSEYIGGGGVVNYSAIKDKTYIVNNDSLIVSFFLGEL